MLTPTQRIAIAACLLIFLAQLWRTGRAWLRARRIEQIERETWRRHAAHSLTPRRHEDATLHR